MTAESAAGFLLRSTRPNEAPGDGCRLAWRWRWRVLAAPAPSDAATIGADDRPASVHLLFAGAGRGGGFGAVLRRGLRAGLLGGAISGRVLTYVWGGRAPSATVTANPHIAPDGVLIVLRGPEAPFGPGTTKGSIRQPITAQRSARGRHSPRISRCPRIPTTWARSRWWRFRRRASCHFDIRIESSPWHANAMASGPGSNADGR